MLDGSVKRSEFAAEIAHWVNGTAFAEITDTEKFFFASIPTTGYTTHVASLREAVMAAAPLVMRCKPSPMTLLHQ